MQGFAVNDAEVTTIQNTYDPDGDRGKGILLHEDTTMDAKSSALPQACYLSHLELTLDQTSSTVASVSAFLTWDSSGNDPMTAETTGNNFHNGLQDTSLRNTAISLDVWVTAPSTQTTAGKCYLWLKLDDGQATLKKARLHWATRRTI